MFYYYNVFISSLADFWLRTLPHYHIPSWIVDVIASAFLLKLGLTILLGVLTFNLTIVFPVKYLLHKFGLKVRWAKFISIHGLSMSLPLKSGIVLHIEVDEVGLEIKIMRRLRKRLVRLWRRIKGNDMRRWSIEASDYPQEPSNYPFSLQKQRTEYSQNLHDPPIQSNIIPRSRTFSSASASASQSYAYEYPKSNNYHVNNSSDATKRPQSLNSRMDDHSQPSQYPNESLKTPKSFWSTRGTHSASTSPSLGPSLGATRNNSTPALSSLSDIPDTNLSDVLRKNETLGSNIRGPTFVNTADPGLASISSSRSAIETTVNDAQGNRASVDDKTITSNPSQGAQHRRSLISRRREEPTIQAYTALCQWDLHSRIC